MKEIIRQYGSAAIAALTAAVLVLLVMQLPVGEGRGVANAAALSIDQNGALTASGEDAFAGYWRSR